MIGQISPASSACENTLNTLRYADRVKELKKPNKGQQSIQQQMMLPRQNSQVQKNQNYVQNVINKAQERFSVPQQPDLYQQFQPVNNSKHNFNPSLQLNFNQNQNQPENFFTPANSDRQNYPLQNNQQPILTTPKQKNNNIIEFDNFGMTNNDPQPQNLIPQQYQHSQFIEQNQPMTPYNNMTYHQSMQFLQNSHHSIKQANQAFDPLRQSQTLFPQDQNLMQSMEIQQLQSNQTSCAKEYFQSNQKNLQDIQKQHDNLIQQILQQEELLIKTHKQSVDQNVSLTHNDMEILGQVEQPGSDIESYLTKLENIVSKKQNMLDNIKNIITQFRSMMKEQLSYTFYQKRNEQMQIEVQEFIN